MIVSYEHYSIEYRDHIVKKALGGTPVAQLAREYSPSAATIHRWVLRAQGKNARAETEEAEHRRLRRELRDAREELAILRKAAEWFDDDAS